MKKGQADVLPSSYSGILASSRNNARNGLRQIPRRSVIVKPMMYLTIHLECIQSAIATSFLHHSYNGADYEVLLPLRVVNNENKRIVSLY